LSVPAATGLIAGFVAIVWLQREADEFVRARAESEDD